MSTPDSPPPKHFTLIRGFALADFFTLGNGFAGAGAILAMMQYLIASQMEALWAAFALLPLALALDTLDGRIARWRRGSALGADLDSLADVISFGMAPAALAFTVGMRGSLDVVVLLYFVGCGIARLARFNVTAAALSDGTGKVKYFEGTPIPSSLLLVFILGGCAWAGRIHGALPLGTVALGPLTLHPLALLFAVNGTTMISKTLRIPKF